MYREGVAATGVPHLGTHAWPEINKSVLAVVDDNIVDTVLNTVKKIDEINERSWYQGFCMGCAEEL